MYTVLIADDERLIRELMIQEIDWQKLGFSVAGVAVNGGEALEMVEELKPDLLLTDIRMPYISGIELAKQVREIRPFMDIAFLTGYEDFSYAHKAIQYNVISYILKSISKEEMEHELKKIKEKMDQKYEMYCKFREPKKQMNWLEKQNLLYTLLLKPDCRIPKEKQEKTESIREGKKSYLILNVEMGSGTLNGDETGVLHTVLEKYTEYVFVKVGINVVILLVGEEKEFHKNLPFLTNELVQGVERVLKRECRVCVSPIFSWIEGSKQVYQSTVSSLKVEREKDQQILYVSELNMDGADQLADQAVQLIENEFTNPELSLVLASDMLHISTSYLGILLKRRYQNTFKNLVTQKRMETAKNYLLGTSMKIIEICEKCGYRDQHYFSYCFKKYYGIAPNRMREEHSEKK